MAVLDLVACPICRAPDSLVRQTTQLESTTHVTYECQQCGTSLVWLGDEMWLEADRWSFQKVGLPERADLLYRSMTAADLRKLAGEKPPPGAARGQSGTPPVWIEMPPADKGPQEEPWAEELAEEEVAEEPQPTTVQGATVVGATVQAQPEPEEAEVRQEAPPAVVQEAPLGATVDGPVVEEAAPSQEEAAAEPEPLPEAAAEPAVVRAPVPPAEVEREAPKAVALEPSPEADVVEATAEPEPPVQPAVEPAEAPVEPPPAELRQPAAEDTRQSESTTGTPVPADAAQPEPPPVRSTPPRRRGRGSPFLVISVGLVLLCLICSAAAMVIYSMWERLPPVSEVQPTETAVPTDTAYPTETPSPVPSETPAEPVSGVEFQGVTDYLSSSGTHYLVGEVLNGTADTLRFVEVLATFYDANGQLVGTGSTFTELSIIEPGSTAPFKMTTLNPPDVGRYDLRVDYSTTTQAPIRLEVLGHTGAAAETGWYHVTGEVRNPHGFAIKFPEIVATYYNAAHEVVRVEVDFAEVDPLEAGQSSVFEVVLTEPPADLVHYTLQTEAVQQ